VAVVVAEERYLRDALDLIEVDFEPYRWWWMRSKRSSQEPRSSMMRFLITPPSCGRLARRYR
jgi:hypothetical protein